MKSYDIVLVRPPFGIPKLSATIFPPFAYLFLAPYLAKNGYEVKILDLQIEPMSKLAEALKSNPAWVGITAITGPDVGTALHVSQKIREINPEIPIVWGGSHATVAPEVTAKHPFVDIVVQKEGESSSVKLTETLKKKEPLENVPGVAFKSNGTIKQTAPAPFINDWDNEIRFGWEFVDIHNYIKKIDGHKNIQLITSRGCPFRCTFCWEVEGYNRKWRAWSFEGTKKAIEEVLPYGVDSVTFQDDEFGINAKRMEAIARYLKAQGIVWSADNGFRVSDINEDIVRMLEETGCDHLSFGGESGSPRMLEYIKKDITVDQILRSAKVTAAHNIGAKYTWIMGFPTETREDMMMTVNLIDKIRDINPRTAQIANIFGPYPGTPIFHDAIKYGWRPPQSLEEWAYLRDETNLPWIDDMWYVRSIVTSCYFAFATDSHARTHFQPQGIKKAVMRLIRARAKARWAAKDFENPWEYKLLFKAKDLISYLRGYKNTGIVPVDATYQAPMFGNYQTPPPPTAVDAAQ